MTPETRRLELRDYIMLALFALIVLAPGISNIPAMDRDESRYAVASTQMLTSGDYIDIRYQENPRYLQPAGIYWLQAAAVALVSSPEAHQIWAYRLPSLLGGLLSVLITGWLGARLFGRKAGLAAAALLAVSFLLSYEARTAKTDAALLASIMLAQAALMQIYLDPSGKRMRAVLFWIALGAGVMLKGPIILMISGSTIAALCLWDRKISWLRGLHAGWGAPLLLAVALPWYIAIGMISDGDFFARAIGRNLLGKVGQSQQSHAGAPGYYLALFTLSFWPGSLLAAFALPYAWRNRAEPAVRFLICWIVPTWVIFEIVATKLPHYVLPTYPALALLAAVALYAPALDLSRAWRIAGWVFAIFWLAITCIVATLGPALVWQMEQRLTPFSIILGLAVIALSLTALWFVLKRRPENVLISLAVAGALVWPNTFARLIPSLDSIWLTPRVAAAVADASQCARTPLATIPYQEPSLVFMHGPYRTNLVDAPALAADAMADDPCTLALIGADERTPFLARAEALGLNLEPVRTIEGVNYSKGDELALTLYAVTEAEPQR